MEAWGSLGCSVSISHLWKAVSLGDFLEILWGGWALRQLCTPGCQHLDGSCQIVTQLFPQTCRTFLGLGQQIQMPQPLPDVGTSVPQVKSGHPPPHRYTVGRPDKLPPALWSHHSGQRAARKRSPESVHWPGRLLITLAGPQGVL